MNGLRRLKPQRGQLVLVVGVTPEAPHFVPVNVGTSGSQDVGQIVYDAGTQQER